jgi:hypothetical protein
MKKVDLSPEIVEALQEMQESAEVYIYLLEEVNEFIMKLPIDRDSPNVAQAYQCLVNLHSVSSICKQFIVKE